MSDDLVIGGGSFVALGPVRSVFVHSEGGLAVDLQHRVLGRDGQALPGLYAADSTGQAFPSPSSNPKRDKP